MDRCGKRHGFAKVYVESGMSLRLPTCPGCVYI